MMVTGEKKEEFREVSSWMESRLFDSKRGGKEANAVREYDEVLFVNGRSKDKHPWFSAEFRGFEKRTDANITYSTGVFR